MMDILVPTDFSACAEFALDAAVSLAKKSEGVIHLLHVVEPVSKAKLEFLEAEMVKKEEDQEKENALVLLAALKDAYPGVEYKIHLETGNVVEVMEKYTNDHEIDLIVMGSHGASGPSRLFVGSNAQKAVRKIKRKILVVKDSLKDNSFNEVVFASSFNMEERDALRQFRDFIMPFSPKVHLVYISTDMFFGLPSKVIKDIMEEAKSEMAPLEVETHYFKDYSVEEGIERLSKKLGASLVGISNHSKNTLKRIISGSNVEALVNHSAIPILSVDYPEVM